MNNLFRKVIITIIMIIICGVVLFLSIIAWFNNKEVITKNIDINISSLDNISFSIDKDNYKDNLSIDDFKDIPNTLEGVSTDTKVSKEKDVSFYKISTYIDDNKEYIIADKDKDNYLLLDFYIKSDKDNILYLSNASNILIDNYDKSIRLLFISDNNTVLFEPNYDIHNERGIHKALVCYDKIISKGPLEEKLSYYGVSKKINKEDKILANKYNLDYYNYINNSKYFINNEDLEIMDIKKGINKMRVYLWIESEDIDYDEEMIFKGLQLNIIFNSK